MSSAVFSADGARVLTASDDKTARLWEAASGKELAVLRGHEGGVMRGVLARWGAGGDGVGGQDGAAVGGGERQGAGRPARP